MPVYGDGGVLEVVLAGDVLPVGGVDVDGRHLGSICQPIDVDADVASVGQHEVFVVFFWRQYSAAFPGYQVIDVFVEAQTALLACLQHAVHIYLGVLVGHFERRSEALADGSNRYEDGVAYHFAIGRSEELVVVAVIELK